MATDDKHAGHGGHGGHGDHAARFRDRFWWSLVLSVPVVAYSEMVQEWLGFTPPEFPGSQWVAPVLGTVVFLYGDGRSWRAAWPSCAAAGRGWAGRCPRRVGSGP
jgi:P-type Cu2+ transporter